MASFSLLCVAEISFDLAFAAVYQQRKLRDSFPWKVCSPQVSFGFSRSDVIVVVVRISHIEAAAPCCGNFAAVVHTNEKRRESTASTKVSEVISFAHWIPSRSRNHASQSQSSHPSLEIQQDGALDALLSYFHGGVSDKKRWPLRPVFSASFMTFWRSSLTNIERSMMFPRHPESHSGGLDFPEIWLGTRWMKFDSPFARSIFSFEVFLSVRRGHLEWTFEMKRSFVAMDCPSQTDDSQLSWNN